MDDEIEFGIRAWRVIGSRGWHTLQMWLKYAGTPMWRFWNANLLPDPRDPYPSIAIIFQRQKSTNIKYEGGKHARHILFPSVSLTWLKSLIFNNYSWNRKDSIQISVIFRIEILALPWKASITWNIIDRCMYMYEVLLSFYIENAQNLTCKLKRLPS